MRGIVDLRSDTFSLPDEGMRRAIYEAEVGNAGFAEDPAVNALERECAAYFGQEDAVFLPSGTMAGQIAIAVRSRPGDLVAIEEHGHNHFFEAGSMATVSGTQALTVPGRRGLMASDDIRDSVDLARSHGGRVSLVVIENTSNFGGGTIYPTDAQERIFALASGLSLPVHVDGARVWNAIAATGRAPSSFVAPGGSISACFSKGLGAPMGSILAGPSSFTERARHVQLLLGGVMRQVGFMAAAALYALRVNMVRLAEDHANCELMAEILAGNPAAELDLPAVQTNLLYFRVRGGSRKAERLLSLMADEGILAFRVGDLVRLVTCLNVGKSDCEWAASRIDALLRGDDPS